LPPMKCTTISWSTSVFGRTLETESGPEWRKLMRCPQRFDGVPAPMLCLIFPSNPGLGTGIACLVDLFVCVKQIQGREVNNWK
jgi:hypothetical protein